MWLFGYSIINLSSSITCCLFSGDIQTSLGISLSCSFVSVSELFYYESIEILVILLAILLPIKSTVASAVLWITLFEEVLSSFVV